MDLQTLNATPREGQGRGSARRARREGQVPGVLYGHGVEPASILINLREFEHLLASHRGTGALVTLDVAGKADLSGPALLKEVQRHPVRDAVLHADFQRVSMDERIQTTVPVVLTGHAKGIVEGGMLDFQLRELDIECLALNVPDQIEIDITEWEIGFSMHVGALTPPDGVKILTDPERAIASVQAPRVEVEPTEVEEGVEGEEGAAGEEGEGEGTAEDAEN